MVNEEELARLIEEVLERSAVPLSPEQISREILKLNRELVPRPIYNPNAKYAPSQRVYHAGAKFERWFEVRMVTEALFIAQFDDGREMTLKHGGTSEQMHFPVTEVAFLASKIDQLIASLPGLHQIGDQWSVSPKEASTPEDVESACRQHGVTCFYHITHLDNLPGILEKGLLCHNCVKDYHDISAEEIQYRRHSKTLFWNPSITLHDCACLFVAPKPPMLSARREEQEEIAYLHINQQILCLSGVEFTDGNAAAKGTRHYRRLEDLDKLHWRVLRAEYWRRDDSQEHAQNKRVRAAEVLVPERVPQTHIVRITVMTSDARERVEAILHEANKDIPVRTDPSMYYPQRTYSRPHTESRKGGMPEPPPVWDDDEQPY